MTNKNYPWGHDRPFNSYAQYIKEKFEGRVQKISIDAGFTCPNRDGSKGHGGCAFCNNDAFMVAYTNPEENSISEQIIAGKVFVLRRYKRAKKFFAYFQAYSNTYDSLENLKKIFDEVRKFPEIIGIIIGTRPDCIDDEKLAYFKELSESYYIVLEYGIESIYDKTLEYINRGHDYASAVDAIKKTAALGIPTGSHLILGLPGETREEILNYATEISKLPLQSIKLHQLQIVIGTRFAVEYKNNPEKFNLFNPDEYIPFVAEFLTRLSPKIMVERFASETPRRVRVAPLWEGLKYEAFVQKLEDYMNENSLWQGMKYKGI